MSRILTERFGHSRPKLRRDHDADAAMLAYRTGLNAQICKVWIEAPIAKSADALKAALMADCAGNSIIAARSEIEAFALARVKSAGAGFFLDSAVATILKPLLFNAADPPSEERINHVVGIAVRTFLAAYRRAA
jgi:AefR-like transcriptional repressor, C-terminal domain